MKRNTVEWNCLSAMGVVVYTMGEAVPQKPCHI